MMEMSGEDVNSDKIELMMRRICKSDEKMQYSDFLEEMTPKLI
jgi:hypothetical protein